MQKIIVGIMIIVSACWLMGRFIKSLKSKTEKNCSGCGKE